MPLLPGDGVHQAAAVRQDDEEVLAVPHHLLQLAARGFARGVGQGGEVEALGLGCLLKRLHSTVSSEGLLMYCEPYKSRWVQAN